ncbi:MAG: DUF2029 domain-containing protein [Chloroflexi bacterium]|nr:DUF2029 domain-containing protein [Chloroflexota bacterium]
MLTLTNLSSRLWRIAIILLLAASIAALTYANHRFASQNPGGNDFLVHWVGTRKFIMEGISPYSDTTARQIQTLAYGHPARPGEHELRVAYPLYSELLYAPFAMIGDYPLARAVWMTFLEIAIALLAILSMRLAGWRPSFWLLPLYLIFSLLWYHGARALINGNAVIIVTVLLVAALTAIRDQRDIAAGIFLTFATLKPHLVILFIPFVILWAISQRRWRLIGWTLGSLLLLVLFGMLFIPNWLLQNIWEILRYPAYTPALSVGAAFEEWWPGVGTQLKWGAALLLAVTLLVEWWIAWGKGFTHFLWAACLTLAISQWIGIATDPGNFIILFLPLVLVFAVWKERWGKGGDWVVFGSLLILFLGLWALFLKTVQYGAQPQQSPAMFFPLPLFVLIGLYWVRWWILTPTRRFLDKSQPSA